MIVKPNESVTVDFTTQTAATGALTNADSLPTGTLSRNGTDDGTVTVTVTNKATGRYKAAFTVPAGYAAGDDLSLYIAATVATIAGGGVVWRGIVDTKRVSDLNDAEAAASGEGAYTGTLTINDGSTGLEGVVVNATRGGVLIATGTTNASGQITDWVFGANTYDLSVRLSGYQPETDTLTVTGNAWTKSISLTLLAAITPPSSPSLCTVGFYVNIGATAIEGAVCKAGLLGVNHASDGTVLSNAQISATTDSDGYAELELVRYDQITNGTGIYAIWVEVDGQKIASVETTIPAAATCYFEDLLL